MKSRSYEIVICGAGIAGISAAYFLAVKNGIKNVLLVDELPPLSLTSDKSTECYRNWWPGPGDVMVKLMNRSIELLDELALQTNNIFHLNRRGYLYLTAQPDLTQFIKFAQEPSELGAGDLRIHESSPSRSNYQPSPNISFKDFPDGADLLRDKQLIQHFYPYLSSNVTAALHVRKAGWLSAQQLGMYLLNEAYNSGIEFYNGKLTAIKVQTNKIISITVNGNVNIPIGNFINAAGPHLKEIGKLLGFDIPVYCELHQKASIKDHFAVIPRDAPLLIWSDPQLLAWNSDERNILGQDHNWLLGPLPSGVHTRPEGSQDGQAILMLWEYKNQICEPIFPLSFDPLYPEIVMRGLSTMIPDLAVYQNKLPKPYVDGGYYTRTIENRPLICKTPIKGSFLIGALSGYGVMASLAAGELLAGLLANEVNNDYTKYFDLRRYDDPSYMILLDNWNVTGQL